ncbi:hypothetical protein DTL42_13460 [Bremerella cremea]|uniref:Uncharacterized protein n=1 Tax=Bremerella cremea TaxID=1031537 RepID=A0A368KQM3_9BACT|nr:hypothetical protein DTL42_13460 [Bremerella cremea]
MLSPCWHSILSCVTLRGEGDLLLEIKHTALCGWAGQQLPLVGQLRKRCSNATKWPGGAPYGQIKNFLFSVHGQFTGLQYNRLQRVARLPVL